MEEEQNRTAVVERRLIYVTRVVFRLDWTVDIYRCLKIAAVFTKGEIILCDLFTVPFKSDDGFV